MGKKSVYLNNEDILKKQTNKQNHTGYFPI